MNPNLPDITELCERIGEKLGKTAEEVRELLQTPVDTFESKVAELAKADLQLSAPVALPAMNRHERRRAAKLARRRKR